MPRIISASRRTDIPRFFPRFFAERRRAGTVEFRNAFGGKGSASLRPEDVLGYLFWTRYAGLFAENLRALCDESVPHVFQYTITGYGQDLEPHTPGTLTAIEDFRSVSEQLPDPACIQWRYDPLIVSDKYPATWHTENFARLAGQLAGATRVVNTSLVEPYLKVIRRMGEREALYRQPNPGRHKTVVRDYPELRQTDESVDQLLADLAHIASQHGMELRSCANPELDLPVAQCCSAEMFTPWGERWRAEPADLLPRPTRDSCRCLESVDIGMDNTCLSGCKYCYVLTSHKSAVEHFKRHDPSGTSLR